MNSSSLIVTVTDKGAFEINVRGDDVNMMTLLGACEYAKNWLMEEIRNEKEDEYTQDNRRGDCKTQDSAYTDTITVSKQEAMNALLDARQTLEQRLQAIVRADDRAVFQIPRQLSSL